MTTKSPAQKSDDSENAYIRSSDFCGMGSYVSSPIECTKQAVTGLTTKPLGRINDGFKARLLNSISGGPFTAAPRLGASILGFITTMFGLSIAAAAVIAVISVTLGGIPTLSIGAAFPISVGRIVSLYFNVFFVVSIPLTLFALQLLIMIPASIMIAWIFAVGAWLVVVAEAIISSPLWAMAHLDTDGEGMGERTSHGYIFYLNLFFRPAMLVIVVGFAYAFAEVLGEFSNSLIRGFVSSLVTSDQHNFLSQWILLLGGLWLLVSVNLKVASVAASLLSLIPTQIFTWIGGHFGSDVGSGIEGQVESSFGHGAGAAGGVLGHAANRGMSEADQMVGAADKYQAEKRAEEKEMRSLTPGTEEYETSVRKMGMQANREADAKQRGTESGTISPGGGTISDGQPGNVAGNPPSNPDRKPGERRREGEERTNPRGANPPVKPQTRKDGVSSETPRRPLRPGMPSKPKSRPRLKKNTIGDET